MLKLAQRFKDPSSDLKQENKMTTLWTQYKENLLP